MTAQWLEYARGPLTGEDWVDWLDRGDKWIDPYLVWADMSAGSGFAAHNPADLEASRKWPFIIELCSPNLPVQYLGGKPHTDVPLICGVLDIAGVYKRPDPADPTRLIFDGQYITAQLCPRDVGHLLHSNHVRRAQLGLPRIPAVDPRVAKRLDRVQFTDQPRVVVGVIDDGFGFAHERLLDEKGWPRVRYLWDQDARRDPRCDPKWQQAQNLGYGAELGPVALDEAVMWGDGPVADPWAPYRDVSYGRYRLDPEAHSSKPVDADGLALPVPSMQPASHGHAVADLAAGFPPIQRGQIQPLVGELKTIPRAPDLARREVIEALGDSAGPTRAEGVDWPARVDSADQSRLVLVQLPVRTVADTSGGSLAVHVLDGIRYIIERARRIPYANEDRMAREPYHTKNPVIVNLSYGALAGGHDGSSILEKAMRCLVDSSDMALWVVLAAGNAHGASAHASADMVPGGEASFTWLVGPDNPLESYLEIWLPDRDVNGVSLHDGAIQTMRIDLETPGGCKMPMACVGQVWLLRDEPAQRGPLAAVVYAKHVAQSEHGTMILVAAAPTRVPTTRDDARAVAPHGEWVVNLKWGGQESATEGPKVCVHAWTERNDLVYGAPRRQQSRIYSDEPVPPPTEFDPEALAAWKQRWPLDHQPPHGFRPQYAMSSLATGKPADKGFEMGRAYGSRTCGEVVVVGGQRIVDAEVAGPSSGGPTRFMTRAQQWALLQSHTAPPDGVNLPVEHRAGPDVLAPSEVSAAVAGLRASGLQSTVQTRISATSAAAAGVTRAIANVQFVRLTELDKPDMPQTMKIAELLIDRAATPADLPDAARATPTPRADDAFRKARARLR